jgi:DNA protecting protein DprA
MIVTLTYSDLPFSLTFQPSPRPVKLDVESFTTDLSLLDQLPECGFAIVGTRTPQRRSFELLEKTMADLRGSNLVIISGLARGIDSRAHELAIEHGLKTIAILGNGIDIDYPRENRHLRKKIVEHGGMVISQFERQMAPIKYNFIHRNQLIAGLSSAVWVVEAAAISGTLNTAKHAASFNRDLYATPCFPGDPFFQGNEKLLSEQHPDRYPIAKPFFGSHSLSPTWRELMQGSSKQTDFFG